MALELMLMPRPEGRRRVVQDGFTVLQRKANNWLHEKKLPTDMMKLGVWIGKLGIGQDLFEYLLYIGHTSRIEKSLEGFRRGTMEDLVNFQVPIILHNAAEIVRARERRGIFVTEQFHLAREAARLTNPIQPQS